MYVLEYEKKLLWRAVNSNYKIGGTMKKIAELLTYELEAAFEKAGYDKQYARVTLSNRPDL